MSKRQLRGKDLVNLGYEDNQIISLVINIIEKEYKKSDFETKLELAEKIIKSPKLFLENTIFKPVALGLLKDDTTENKDNNRHSLLISGIDYKIFGNENIEPGAIHQMEMAMKLPISVAGALMADAHEGYGLPIGGVLATNNVVIPYAVGVDIGCRMALSIYQVPDNYITRYRTNLKRILIENTKFGQKEVHEKKGDLEIFERREFKEISFLKKWHHTAINQIGTSGSGNHFAEFGEIEITEENLALGLKKGKYLGFLTHSGSRHLGYEIANYYTKIAMDKCRLISSARNLAWLALNTDEGHEYWQAMTLAGDYAKANHDFIHNLMSKSLKEKPVLKIENHHNFAWKEKLNNGTEIIVHRKGATPAHTGTLGLIPGSMATKAYIVCGKGNENSLNSASHGAGRLMSRGEVIKKYKSKDLKQFLEKAGVELIGGGVDESPMAYKDIDSVMFAQKELIEVVGTFMPRIVRMNGEKE